jgi:hypothetical protein
MYTINLLYLFNIYEKINFVVSLFTCRSYRPLALKGELIYDDHGRVTGLWVNSYVNYDVIHEKQYNLYDI